MQSLNYWCFSFLLVFLLSCNFSTSDTENKNVNATEIEETSSKQKKEGIEQYEKEIQMIREYIMTVRQKVNELDKIPEDLVTKEENVSIVDYKNEKDQLIQREVYLGEMGDQGWTIYYKTDESGKREIIYSQYFDRENTETDPDGTKRTILRQFYSIGSLDKDTKENLVVILKHGMMMVEGEELQKYIAQYDKIKEMVSAYN